MAKIIAIKKIIEEASEAEEKERISIVIKNYKEAIKNNAVAEKLLKFFTNQKKAAQKKLPGLVKR